MTLYKQAMEANLEKRGKEEREESNRKLKEEQKIIFIVGPCIVYSLLVLHRTFSILYILLARVAGLDVIIIEI